MGQNLFVSGGTAPKGVDVANNWYSESKNYDYASGTGKNNAVVGHFTQLVWKSTTQIGCIVAEGSCSGYSQSYFVCWNYFPGGNILGQYPKNVLKPTS